MQTLNHDPVSSGPEGNKHEVCARCGKPMTVQDKTCASCGHARGTPVQSATGHQSTALLIVAAIGLVIVIAAVIGTNSDRTSTAPAKFEPATLLPGATVQLRFDGGTAAPVVPTQEFYKEWMKLAAAEDTVGEETMMNEGELFWTPNGTKAKILEGQNPQSGSFRVRILDGPLYGQAVWTNKAFVKEDQPADVERAKPLSSDSQFNKTTNNYSGVDSHNTEAGRSSKSLPVSRSEIMGWYIPPPKELGTFDTRAGTVVYTYALKHATLELQERNDRPDLVRASLKFNIPEIRSATDTVLALWADCAIFAKNIAGMNFNDPATLKRLGFDHAYDPGPDEIVNNGVRVRRFTKGGVLFFELTPE